MPSIEISEEQLAYVQALREELEAEVPYGQVRNLDAVQYLIDHHRKDGDLDVDIEADLESDVDPDEATDGGSSVDPSDAGSTTTPPTDSEAPGEVGNEDAGHSEDGGPPSTTAESSDDTDAESDDAAAPADPSTTTAVSNDADGGTTTRVASSPDPSQLSGASGDDTLNEMINLLDDHDDVWEETSAGETKYQVELPDGNLEQAATKDDVRAILFRHYR